MYKETNDKDKHHDASDATTVHDFQVSPSLFFVKEDRHGRILSFVRVLQHLFVLVRILELNLI
jgi:hypothetical protein